MPEIENAGQLLAEHRITLFRVALRYTRSIEDAEDCLQDAMVRMLRFWDDARKDTLLHWACTVVKSQALDLIRKRASRRQEFHVSLEDICEPAIRSHEGATIARVMLAKASRKLSAGDRQALALWISGSRSRTSVGQAMKSREYRAIHRLRKRLAA